MTTNHSPFQHIIVFDTVKRTAKPKNVGKQILSFHAKGTESMEIALTIPEIAKYVVRPYSWSYAPFRYTEKCDSDHWRGTSLLILDFDKIVKDPLAAIEHFQTIGLRPNIAYTTFTDSPQQRKFRLIFALDFIILDNSLRDWCIKNLGAVVQGVDGTGFNSSRIFHGGLELLHLDPVENSRLEFINALNDIQLERDGGKRRSYVNPITLEGGIPDKSRTRQTEEEISKRWGRVKFDWEAAKNRVKILGKFLSGEQLYYEELWGLATNLHHIRGGLKLMRETMEKCNAGELGPARYERKHFNIFNFKEGKSYPPQKLESFSKFPEDADVVYITDAIMQPKGVVEVIEAAPEPIELEEARRILEREMRRSLASEEDQTNIDLIKAVTGIGKSMRLTEIEFPDLVLGFNTHKRKEEMARDFIKAGREFNMLPEVPETGIAIIDGELDFLKSANVPARLFGLIQNIIDDVVEIDGQHIPVPGGARRDFNDYIAARERAQNSPLPVLTTHANISLNEWRGKTIIFDEDPLTTYWDIGDMTVETLVKCLLRPELQGTTLAPLFQGIIEFLQGVQKNQPFRFPAELSWSNSQKETRARLDTLIETRIVPAEIKKFLQAEIWCLAESWPHGVPSIGFIRQIRLRDTHKYIVLSATVSEEIWERLYPGRIRVCHLDNVRTVGKVIQYCRHSYSKSSIWKRETQIAQEVGDLPVITYSTCGTIFRNVPEGIYFFNCAGYNDLEGKDLAIVGTPYIPHSVVLLMAESAGIDWSWGTELARRDVIWKGLKFSFTTYENPDLQALQLGLIEGELVQAIGRARHLHHDVIVKVWSSFPVKNAEWRREFAHTEGLSLAK